MTELQLLLKKNHSDYKHFLLFLYFPIYLIWFTHLEASIRTKFHVIHMEIDDYIPFCEYFIIPYLLWFAYVAIGMLYMGLNDKSEFFRMCIFLFTGMSIFLIVSTLYPNGHLLRPTTFENTNIFTKLCAWLYSMDTATNLFPSIHVYNSIGVHLAVTHSSKTKNSLVWCLISGFLMISIILSTVFLKQHSVFDVITALFTAFVMYQLIYKTYSEVPMK